MRLQVDFVRPAGNEIGSVRALLCVSTLVPDNALSFNRTTLYARWDLYRGFGGLKFRNDVNLQNPEILGEREEGRKCRRDMIN